MSTKPSMRGKLAWGRRRAFDGGPAPALPNHLTVTTNPANKEICRSDICLPYPYFFIYDSQEVSRKQIDMRNKDRMIVLPPPPPTQIA
jgi:hypothetical protein